MASVFRDRPHVSLTETPWIAAIPTGIFALMLIAGALGYLQQRRAIAKEQLKLEQAKARVEYEKYLEEQTRLAYEQETRVREAQLAQEAAVTASDRKIVVESSNFDEDEEISMNLSRPKGRGAMASMSPMPMKMFAEDDFSFTGKKYKGTLVHPQTPGMNWTQYSIASEVVPDDTLLMLNQGVQNLARDLNFAKTELNELQHEKEIWELQFGAVESENRLKEFKIEDQEKRIGSLKDRIRELEALTAAARQQTPKKPKPQSPLRPALPTPKTEPAPLFNPILENSSFATSAPEKRSPSFPSPTDSSRDGATEIPTVRRISPLRIQENLVPISASAKLSPRVSPLPYSMDLYNGAAGAETPPGISNSFTRPFASNGRAPIDIESVILQDSSDFFSTRFPSPESRGYVFSPIVMEIGSDLAPRRRPVPARDVEALLVPRPYR